ncbi:MAG: hypothetical protein V4489_09390 [Chlamydiota bacterium]
MSSISYVTVTEGKLGWQAICVEHINVPAGLGSQVIQRSEPCTDKRAAEAFARTMANEKEISFFIDANNIVGVFTSQGGGCDVLQIFKQEGYKIDRYKIALSTDAIFIATEMSKRSKIPLIIAKLF